MGQIGGKSLDSSSTRDFPRVANRMATSANNNTKMKGLLKGLRYISQIFDDNKERQDMQIGYPTDVKHVAHIGWDGPSTTASSPSWMNEFQAPPPGNNSAPLGNGEMKNDSGVKWVSEDSTRKGSRGARSPGHDMPDLPKSSRRQTSSGHGGGGGTDSPKREKSDKPKQTRRSSKNRDTSDSSARGIRQPPDSSEGSESPQNLPDIPKKTRRKKSKDASVGSSSRRSNPHAGSETCSEPGHQSATMSKCSSNDLSQNSFQGGEDKGYT